MADVEARTPVLYAEPGSSWWPVLWGPVFAVLGLTVEVLTTGPVHVLAWALLAVAFAAAAAAWVAGRRRVSSVRLTPVSLVLGRESLPLDRIVAVDEVGDFAGAPVLGGGWTVPKGTREAPVLLDEPYSGSGAACGGRVVLAWARDPEALTAALRSVLEEGPDSA